MGTNTLGGFLNPPSRWTIGGAVASAEGGIVEALLKLSTSILIAAPTQLQAALRALPSDYRPPSALKIIVAGGSLPKSVALEAASRLNAEIEMQYGSTEAGVVTAGPVALRGYAEGSTGFVCPGCQVEIVDENGRLRDRGQSGIIRVRTPWMALSYLDGPNASVRDGWFYPGDVGYFTASGELVVAGRQDDVINMGGVKLSAAAIESRLTQLPGVNDAGVVFLDMTGPIGRLAVAIVPATVAWPELRERVLSQLGQPADVIAFDRLPRNEMGKLVRSELARQVKERVQPS
jgi:acyl-coenzyme A synthetase/AMP-(fatty) acid ligase